IKFNDSESAEKGIDAISARYDEIVKTFIDYTPDEMYKLDSAVLEKKGNYVIFIVCADNAKAQAAYEKLFG
ncbi:MAG: DUF4358 domain-containing protein, partial [Ruminococcus sp.]|nr:DUF4358 domain-containing protein [Ruminococcus sp.]